MAVMTRAEAEEFQRLLQTALSAFDETILTLSLAERRIQALLEAAQPYEKSA